MSDYFDEMGWTPLQNNTAPDYFLQLARYLRDAGMWDLLPGQNDSLAPPASAAARETLEEVKIEEDNTKQCPICLKTFQKDNIMTSLPCKHSFHKECIIPWLEKTNSCPLCRHELPTDDEDYEMHRKELIRAANREKDLETLHNSMFG